VSCTPLELHGPADVAGMVFSDSYARTQYQSHHFPPNIPSRPMSSSRSGRFRSRDIPHHRKIRITARRRSVRSRRKRSQRGYARIGS
jgi:hypothetical protein